MRIVDAVGVLGDPHAPDQAGAGERRARVPAGGLGDVGGGDPGDRLGAVEGELGEGRPPVLEALGARGDEVEIRQALVEDDAGHRVEQRDVGARARLDEEIGLVAQLHALGVDDDDPGAAGHGPPEADGDDRVIG